MTLVTHRQAEGSRANRGDLQVAHWPGL